MTGDGRLAAELIDLRSTAPSTLAYALHKVVARIFDMVSARSVLSKRLQKKSK